jgi:catechol 2,3-dioxygenase-like lactoylglutathione lyase family enzyme
MTAVSVCYPVPAVEEAIAFYTEQLGFQVEQHPGPGFASLSRDNLRLLLNDLVGSGGPGNSAQCRHTPRK